MVSGSKVVTTHLITPRRGSAQTSPQVASRDGPAPSSISPTLHVPRTPSLLRLHSSPGSNIASPFGAPFSHYQQQEGSTSRSTSLPARVMMKATAYDSGGEGEDAEGQPFETVVDNGMEEKALTPQVPICTSSSTQTVTFSAKGTPVPTMRSTASQYDYVDPNAPPPKAFVDLAAQTYSLGVARGAGPDQSMWETARADDVCVGQWRTPTPTPTPSPPPAVGIQTAPEMQFVHMAIPERHGLPGVPDHYYAENNQWFEDEMRICMGLDEL